MAGVEFEDFSIQVKKAIEEKALKFLEEAASEVESQARRNSRVDTGQLKGSWTHVVDESAQKATIGSPLENAIWEEFGTGEYALHGDGRKGGWYYVDDAGNGHFTHGKTPNRTLQRAFDQKKTVIQKRANQIFGELDKE
jgi:hypothetical protein